MDPTNNDGDDVGIYGPICNDGGDGGDVGVYYPICNDDDGGDVACDQVDDDGDGLEALDGHWPLLAPLNRKQLHRLMR